MKNLMNFVRGWFAAAAYLLANDVRQQTEETRALDGARELTLLLGGDGGDAARHDLAALGDVTHQQLGILVVDLRRIRAREPAGFAATEQWTACTSFSHDPTPLPLRLLRRHAGGAGHG